MWVLHIDLPVQPVHHYKALKRIRQTNLINGLEVDKIPSKQTLTSHYSRVWVSYYHTCDSISCAICIIRTWCICCDICCVYIAVTCCIDKHRVCQIKLLLHLVLSHPTKTSLTFCLTSWLRYDFINDLCCLWQSNDITAVMCWCLCTLALTWCVTGSMFVKISIYISIKHD